MNDIKEKFDKLICEAEYLYDCMEDEAELYKGYILEDDYNKLEELKEQLLIFLNNIRNSSIIKKLKNEETYLKHQKEFDNLYSCFVSHRTSSMFNLAFHTYHDQEELLLTNTKKILDDCDIEDIRDALKGINDNAQDNMCILLLLGKLQLECEAIEQFYKNTNIHDKFYDLLIDKIEKILPNSNIRKAMQLEKHKIMQNAVISEIDNDNKDLKNNNKNPLLNSSTPTIKDITNYSMPLLQTDITNKLIGLHYKESDLKKPNDYIAYKKDVITNSVTLQRDNVTVEIDASDIENLKLDTKVHKTLITLMHKLTSNLPYKRISKADATKYMEFTLTLAEYMELRGMKEKKHARQQLKESLKILKRTNISFKGKDKDDNEYVGEIGILDSWTFYNGKATITMSPTFINHLSYSNLLMNYNSNLLKINDRENPSSFNLGNELLIDARRNKNKPKRNKNGVFIINIEKLISVCSSLNDKKNFFRTRERFEKDMDALIDNKILKSWEYCTKGRQTLSDEELQASTKHYEDFIDLYILYEPYNLD